MQYLAADPSGRIIERAKEGDKVKVVSILAPRTETLVVSLPCMLAHLCIIRT